MSDAAALARAGFLPTSAALALADALQHDTQRAFFVWVQEEMGSDVAQRRCGTRSARSQRACGTYGSSTRTSSRAC
jgi:hypothetical protein